MNIKGLFPLSQNKDLLPLLKKFSGVINNVEMQTLESILGSIESIHHVIVKAQ